jgi:hypothetical protein
MSRMSRRAKHKDAVPDAAEMRPDARRVSVPLMLRHTVPSAKQVPDQRVRVRLAKSGVSGSEW